jgi:hypothetical protein
MRLLRRFAPRNDAIPLIYTRTNHRTARPAGSLPQDTERHRAQLETAFAWAYKAFRPAEVVRVCQ